MFSSFSPAVPDKQRLTGYQMTCTRILNTIFPSDSKKSATPDDLQYI